MMMIWFGLVKIAPNYKATSLGERIEMVMMVMVVVMMRMMMMVANEEEEEDGDVPYQIGMTQHDLMMVVMMMMAMTFFIAHIS